MLIKTANAITGGLSKTSKMPELSWGTPAIFCQIGRHLAKIKGSVCFGCYALKGAYRWPKVAEAYQRRYHAWTRARGDGNVSHWVEAMTKLILNRQTWFRWFDSGDLESVEQLEAICQIAKNCPETHFWVPTRELKILMDYRRTNVVPPNVVTRVSAQMVGQSLPVLTDLTTGERIPTSTVQRNSAWVARDSYLCPAPTQGNSCGDCRACWDGKVADITYTLH